MAFFLLFFFEEKATKKDENIRIKFHNIISKMSVPFGIS